MKRTRVGLFGYPSRANFRAAEAGLRKAGVEVVPQVASCFSTSQPAKGIHGAVVLDLFGRGPEIADYYSKRGVRVAVMTPPLLAPADGTDMLSVSPWQPSELPEPDFDREEGLGLEYPERKRVKAQYVLVVGQRTGNPEHGVSRNGMDEWAKKAIGTVRSLCDSRVVWRPHPTDVWPCPAADRMSNPADESLEDALSGAWLVVTHSSQVGLEALVAGLPVVAQGDNVPWSEYCGSLSRFKDLAGLDEDDRRELAARVAAMQMTLPEIASGELFSSIFPQQDEPAPEPPRSERLASVLEGAEAEAATLPPGGEGKDASGSASTQSAYELPDEDQPFTALKGVGDAAVAKLKEGDIETWDQLREASDEQLGKLGIQASSLAALATWRINDAKAREEAGGDAE